MTSDSADINPHAAAISLVAIGFGLLTIKEGGAILLGGEAAQASAGNYVTFVLWFNFLAVVIAAATAFVFAAFGAHVYAGGAYEMRTVIAMSFRTLLWVAITAISRRSLSRQNVSAGQGGTR